MQIPQFLDIQTIVGSAPAPHLLVTGGVHGDELEPVAALQQASKLLSREKLSGRVTVVPVVNRPAVVRNARCGDDQLDLARICPGRHDGTISERIAWQLAELIRSADVYIDLHTGGATMEILPLAGYMLHDDPAILDTQRRMARAFNLPVVWGTTAELEGRSLSVARDAGVPAIYVEHGGGGSFDPAGVAALIEGTLGVMTELEILERRAAESQVRFVVEDNRPRSGFLQIQHPAPCDGFFEPAMRIGEWIESGGRIGCVCRADSEEQLPVSAIESGRLLMLRTERQVCEGDPLAAILPLPESADHRGTSLGSGSV